MMANQSHVKSKALTVNVRSTIPTSDGDISLGEAIKLATSKGLEKWIALAIAGVWAVSNAYFMVVNTSKTTDSKVSELATKVDQIDEKGSKYIANYALAKEKEGREKEVNLTKAISDLTGQVKTLGETVGGLRDAVNQNSQQIFELSSRRK